MDVFAQLYTELKGTRSRLGSLVIPGFTYEDYEELYFTLLEELRDYIGDDYFTWYEKQVISYKRYVAAHATRYDFFFIHDRLPVDEHSIQQQLVILKFYLYKQTYNSYREV